MNEQETNTSTYEEEGITLSELFSILKNHFRWCVIGFLVVVGFGIGYVMTAIPEYESTSTILVNPIQESSTMDSLLSQDIAGGKKIATETELLSSSLSIQRTLDQMDLGSYFDHDGVPYDDITIFGGPGAVGILKKRLTVTAVKDTNIVKLAITDNNPKFAHDFMEKLCKSYDVILTDIAKNSKSAQRQFIENQIPENDAELKQATDALGMFRKTSNIIQLTDKTSLLVSGGVYYQMKIEPLQMENQEAQVGIAQFQKDWTSAFKAPLPTVDEIKKDKEISSLLSRLNDLQKELNMYEAVSALNMSGGNTEAGGTGVTLGVNASMINRSTQTQSRTNDLNNSVIQVKKHILDRVGAICGIAGADTYYQAVTKFLSTEVLMSVLNAREKVYSDELGELPDLQTRLSELEREVNVYESVGLKLRDMLQETKLVEAAVNGNVTVIDVASMPLNPVKPNKMLILAVSMLLGLAFGVLLALLVNAKDDSIATIDDLKKVQGKDIPLLTWIPFFISKKKASYPSLVVYNNPLSFQSERFKLVANLFYTNKTNGRLFSVTSCGMAEGKSTVISNIAVSLAQMGKKVLLIDGDLRLPSLMPFFNLDAKDVKGLVDVVLENVPLNEVILSPLSDVPNLHLLPGGTKPLVPSAIYTNPYLEETLGKLKKLYDYIIIDAPPLLYASELLPIGKLVDSMLIVVRAEVTTKSGLRELIETFLSTDVKIAGTVFNACGRVALTSARGEYRYGAYSYYGYGYGYGETPYDKHKKNEKKQHSHSIRWYRNRYKLEIKKRGSIDRPLGKASLAFPDGMPTDTFETTVYDPLFHKHHGVAAVSESSALSGEIENIENDNSARGGKNV